MREAICSRLALSSMRWPPASCPSVATVTATIFESILNRAPAPAVRLNPDVPPKLDEVNQ